MTAIENLTLGDLRTFLETLTKSPAVPRPDNTRSAALNALDACGYPDDHRLLDLNLNTMAHTLAAVRPDLANTTRATYLTHVRKAARLLLDQTAAAQGEQAPYLPQLTSYRRTGRQQHQNTPDQAPSRISITVTIPASLTQAEAGHLSSLIKALSTDSPHS